MEELVGGVVDNFHVGLGEVVSAVGAIVGIIVWLVRLEGRVNSHDKDITRNDTRIQNLETTVVQRLGAIEMSLANIEGRLSIVLGEKSKSNSRG